MKKQYYLIIENEEGLEAVRDTFGNIPENIHVFTAFESEYGRALPRMQRGSFDERLLNSCSPLLIRNLEQLSTVLAGDERGNIIFDSSVPILNHRAYLAFKELAGADFSFIASYELTKWELSDLYDKLGEYRERMIIPLYGYIPLMVSAGCTKKAKGKCDKKSEVICITDRKNVGFSVANDCEHCINTIFNSVPYSGQMLLYEPDLFEKAAYKIEFTVESPSQIREILRLFITDPQRGIVRTPEFSYTTGHLKKKVL